MNKELETYARAWLKHSLLHCTEAEQHLFKRMYAKGKLSLTIDQVVDNMANNQLDFAMTQVQRTIDKKLIQLIHKTCPSWGETACGINIYLSHPPKTVERWDRVTCKECLADRKKKQSKEKL